MTVALILHGRVHQILRNQTEIPKWPPFANGDMPLLVKAPDDVQIGDFYNVDTGEITPQSEHHTAMLESMSDKSLEAHPVCPHCGSPNNNMTNVSETDDIGIEGINGA